MLFKLLIKTDCTTKIWDTEKKIPTHNKYITTNECTKFSGMLFDEGLKQTKLATNNDLNTAEQRSIRKEENIEKVQIFDLRYILGKKFVRDNDF